MNPIYRKLKAEDIESVWQLFQGIKAEKIDMSFAKIRDKDEILSYVENPAELTYVAVSEEEPCRVLCLIKGRREMTDEKKHAAFLSAATHPDARGKGLVAALTGFALKEMENAGVTIARIYVYSNNRASVNAIKKLDFIHAGSVLRILANKKNDAQIAWLTGGKTAWRFMTSSVRKDRLVRKGKEDKD